MTIRCKVAGQVAAAEPIDSAISDLCLRHSRNSPQAEVECLWIMQEAIKRMLAVMSCKLLCLFESIFGKAPSDRLLLARIALSLLLLLHPICI